tara:strand:- start:1376 stop:1765 length:390 start_codon:yes stop_codon:yes gene_type:complete
MHEMSILQSLLQQVLQYTQQSKALRVAKIHISVGPLSGVDAGLLQNAFPICKSGTVAQDATLLIYESKVEVFCLECKESSIVKPNKLVCPVCLNWKTRLIKGDELTLDKIEFERLVDTNNSVDKESNYV